MKTTENEMIDELSKKYDKAAIETNLSRYHKLIRLFDSESLKVFDTILLILMYLMFVISFRFEVYVFGLNLLKAIPITYFTYYVCDKLYLEKILKNNLYFTLILIISLVNLYFIRAIDINMFFGFLIFTIEIVNKKIKVSK